MARMSRYRGVRGKLWVEVDRRTQQVFDSSQCLDSFRVRNGISSDYNDIMLFP